MYGPGSYIGSDLNNSLLYLSKSANNLSVEGGNGVFKLLPKHTTPLGTSPSGSVFYLDLEGYALHSTIDLDPI